MPSTRSRNTRIGCAAVASTATAAAATAAAGPWCGIFAGIALFMFCAFLDEAIHPVVDDVAPAQAEHDDA